MAEEFANWCRQLRLEKSWSQSKAGSVFGLSPGFVGLIENGERIPSVEAVEKVAVGLAREGIEVDVRQLVAMRERDRLSRAMAGLRGVGTGAVTAAEMSDAMRATDADDAQGVAGDRPVDDGPDQDRLGVVRDPADDDGTSAAIGDSFNKFRAYLSAPRGRPSKAQQLRERITFKCRQLDQTGLLMLMGYLDRLIEETTEKPADAER